MTKDKDTPTAPAAPADADADAAEDVIEHLDTAIEAVLCARVKVGGLPIAEGEVPVEALDQALGEDQEYRAARGRFRSAWDALMVLVPGGETCRKALHLEEAVNALVNQGVDVGWKLGLAACGERQRSRD